MKIGDAFPGNWLRASDLGDDDHTVTITEVKSEMVGQGQQAALKLVLYFRELEKPCVCNKTNATTIAKLHGDETDDWIGRRVTLWVNPDVQFGGETVSAIRVRSKAPPQTPRRPDAVLSFAQAVTLCAEHGISEEELKDYLKLQGFTGYNSGACTAHVHELVSRAGAPPPDAEDDDKIPF